MSTAIEWVKRIYLYAAAGIGLVLIIIGSVQLINLALKTWIFTQADVYRPYPYVETVKDVDVQQPSQEEMEKYQREEAASSRQRQAANALAMVIVGTPVFLYHWRIARKES